MTFVTLFKSLWKGEATPKRVIFLFDPIWVCYFCSSLQERSLLPNGINTIICGLNLIFCDKSSLSFEKCAFHKDGFLHRMSFRNSSIEIQFKAWDFLVVFLFFPPSKHSSKSFKHIKIGKTVCSAFRMLALHCINATKTRFIHERIEAEWDLSNSCKQFQLNKSSVFLTEKNERDGSTKHKKKCWIGFSTHVRVLSNANGAWYWIFVIRMFVFIDFFFFSRSFCLLFSLSSYGKSRLPLTSSAFELTSNRSLFRIRRTSLIASKVNSRGTRHVGDKQRKRGKPPNSGEQRSSLFVRSLWELKTFMCGSFFHELRKDFSISLWKIRELSTTLSMRETNLLLEFFIFKHESWQNLIPPIRLLKIKRAFKNQLSFSA